MITVAVQYQLSYPQPPSLFPISPLCCRSLSRYEKSSTGTKHLEIFFSLKFLCSFLFEGTFTSFFKDKYKICHKSHNKNFFACWWKNLDPFTDPDPGGSKTYGSGTLVYLMFGWNGYGSGARRLKNIRILRIRNIGLPYIWLKWIRIRIGRPWMSIPMLIRICQKDPIRPDPDLKHWHYSARVGLFFLNIHTGSHAIILSYYSPFSRRAPFWGPWFSLDPDPTFPVDPDPTI